MKYFASFRHIARDSRFWPLLALLIALLLLMFLVRGWNGGPEPVLEVVASGSGWQRVMVAREGGVADTGEPLSDSFVVISPANRERVLQNLGRFRADYKQLAPFLRVSASPGMPSRSRLADRLGSALAHYGLGRTVPEVASPPLALEPGASLVLICNESHMEIAHRLLQALSPYFRGEVLIQFDESLRVDTMQLLIGGRPRFTAEGTAVFN